MVGAFGLVVLCAVIAVAMWSSGDDAARVVSKYVALFGLAMFCVLAMGIYADLGIAHRSSVKLGRERGIPATVVPGSYAYFGLFQAIWVCFAAMFLTAAVETATVAWRTHWPLVLVFVCLGLFSASAPALALAGRLRRGRLALTDSEIIHYGWSSETSLRWDDVLRVNTAFEMVPLIGAVGRSGARWNHRYTTPSLRLSRKPLRFWALDQPPLSGWIVLECPRFSADRHLLYHYLAYYAENPGTRAELGTASSMERWRVIAGSD